MTFMLVKMNTHVQGFMGHTCIFTFCLTVSHCLNQVYRRNLDQDTWLWPHCDQRNENVFLCGTENQTKPIFWLRTMALKWRHFGAMLIIVTARLCITGQIGCNPITGMNCIQSCHSFNRTYLRNMWKQKWTYSWKSVIFTNVNITIERQPDCIY